MRRNRRMLPMHPDGNIDVKFIEILPNNDFIEIVNAMNKEEWDYFDTHVTIVEGPIKPTKIDHTLEDKIDWGFGFDAKKILERMRERILRLHK